MLAIPNPDDFAVGREAEADKNLLVRFFIKEREDKAASQAQGRPIFRETEYVEIRVPGKRDAQACRPATERDKQRFPRHYDMFKRRVEVPAEGTPLSEWPQITRSTIEQLSFLHIKTVEQLANANDTDLGTMHGGISLKQRAAEFLKYADKTKLIAEKEALEAQMKEQQEALAEQTKQIAALQATVANMLQAKNEDDDDEPTPRRKSRRAKQPPELETAGDPEV